ncbi:MAG TPA: EamA family transporter [Longimicrobiales bacterium]
MSRQDAATAAGEARATGPAAPARTDLVLLLMVLIWAVNFSVVKAALAELPPLAFNALRFPLASLVVLAALRRRGPVPLPRRDHRLRITMLALVANVVYQLLFIFGMDRTRAGNASVLLAGTPVLTALFSAWAGHERLSARAWVGVSGAVIGMALIVASGGGELGFGAETLAGDLMMIGASLAWALYTVGARDMIAEYGPIPVTAWTLWIGSLGLLGLGAPALARLDWGTVSLAAWGGVAYAGGLGIGLAYLIWNTGVHRIGNTRTAMYSNLVPVVALVVAWAWLGERPLPWQVVGAAVIIGGITLAHQARVPAAS